MKYSVLAKAVAASILSLSLMTLPATAQAPTETAPGDTTTAPATGGDSMQNTQTTEGGDRDFDWGWLGLIGLAGLAGLARKREEPVRYRDPDPANRSGL